MNVWVVLFVVLLLIVFWWKHQARKGRKEEYAISSFFRALEFIHFKNNPKTKEVRERNLLTAAAYFQGYNKRQNVGALKINELRLLAEVAEKRYGQRADTLLYFILYLKTAKKIRSDDPQWNVDVNDSSFISELSKMDIKKIALVVQENLRETTPTAGAVTVAEMYVERNPNWYDLRFTE